MYKMIAIDLDGTMLNSYGEITERTKRIIKETMKKGVEVVIASGRTIDSIKAIAKEIEGEKYIIAGNGAVICDLENDKTIYENYMPLNKTLDIIKICEENSISYSVYTNKTIVANTLRYNVLYYYRENVKKTDEKKTSITLVENVSEYLKNMKDEKVMKIMICDKTEVIFKSILKKIKDNEKLQNINVLDVEHMTRKVFKNGTQDIVMEYFYTEVSMKDADKWYALEFLMDKLNIHSKEVMTIGDNINDKKMIQNAGYGVAMGESAEEIKKIADYITEDNNNEGVANIIEKIYE